MTRFPLASLLCISLLTTCGDARKGVEKASPPSIQPPVSSTGRIQLQVVNYPLAYFAERVGGTEVDVHFRAPNDGDPAFWEPTDADIAALQKADLIVLNGATYSKWLDQVSLPESRVLDTSAGFKKDYIEVKDTVTHSHGKAGEHSHTGTAFTTWLDFKQAILQAEAICAELQRLRPEQIELFALNFDLLKRDLLALDQEMEATGKKLAGQPLVASHPVYQYWARRYGINLRFVHWEPETVPDEAAMGDLKKLLVDHPAKLMVWEGGPALASVEKLKALGIGSVIFDPGGNVSDKGNWLDVMKANLSSIGKVVIAP